MGVLNAKVPTQPVKVIDSETSLPIADVLVVPWYSSSWVVFGGLGWFSGPVAKCPFVYRQGEEFKPYQAKWGGIVWGAFWALTGGGAGLDGVVVYARGYFPREFGGMWWENRTLAMEPCESRNQADWVRYLFLVAAKGEEHPGMSDIGWIGRKPIEFDFDEDDLALVEEFWAKPYTISGSEVPAGSTQQQAQ